MEELSHLINLHAGTLQLLARSYCTNPEDVVQEAFAKLMGQAPTDPVAWLYRVVRNRAIDLGRMERRRAKRESQVARQEAWFQVEIVDSVTATEVIAALQDLPEESRSVIIARLWGELTLQQIAAAEGCSVSTVHRRYEDGIARLQERFGVTWPKTS
ncbi:MAG: RNA polymerase sigma factor [Fimbriiglobus sp.]